MRVDACTKSLTSNDYTACAGAVIFL